MFNKSINFFRGVSVNRTGRIGVILTTAVFITFLLFETAHSLGLIRNAYLGLITYLAFPVLFITGLVLIPIGWHQLRRSTGKTTRELLDQRFSTKSTRAAFSGARVFRIVGGLTVLNVVILSLTSVRMLHFMDSSEFCGTACHTVMNPEWVTYQKSPHARVKCVECHVGEGFDALVASKINGVRQMVLAATRTYNRPIPTPVHTLRPARETCEHCHWPEKFYGQRLVTHVTHAMDSASTPAYTTLNLKIDAGGPGHVNGAHWHVHSNNRVSYTSAGNSRIRMVEVRAVKGDKSEKLYRNRRLARFEQAGGTERMMDCIDCHNRATHIYRDPESIIDDALRNGRLDRRLPYIKSLALAALTGRYNSEAAALEAIEHSLTGYYRRNYPAIASASQLEIEKAVSLLEKAYLTYRHHHMSIEWGHYTSYAGHDKNLGCFRCHNDDLINDEGEQISNDCTQCHSILALDSPQRLQFLGVPDSSARDRAMHEYLRREFLNNRY